MTYQECKNQVLKLLNQYTISGNAVAEGYNNQSDYIRRIPGLINDAMMEISTTVRKIEARWMLLPEDGVLVGDTYRFEAPEDFFQWKSGDSFFILHGNQRRNQHYFYRGQRYLVVDKWAVEECEPMVIYYRLPTLLGEDIEPAPTKEQLQQVLDTTEDASRAIPYYVAGTLALHDDPFLAATLMNGYEDKLAKLQPLPYTEIAPVTDVYDFYRPPYFYGY